MSPAIIIAATCVGIFGILCVAFGYALGKKDGILEQFAMSNTQAEMLEFVVDEVDPGTNSEDRVE